MLHLRAASHPPGRARCWPCALDGRRFRSDGTGRVDSGSV